MGRITFITFEEFQQVYKAEKDKIVRLVMLLAFGSGLRLSEIIGYQRKFKRRKDKTTGQINITQDNTSIPPLTKEMINLPAHQIRLEDAKGGKWRTTVTSPNLNESMLKLLPIITPRRTIQYQVEKSILRTLKKKMSIHVLRHGFGNYQANVLKLPLPIVQQMMGHSNVATTSVYTKANPEESINMSWKAMGGS